MNKLACACIGFLILCASSLATAQTKTAIQNKELTVRVRAQDGAYEIVSRELPRPVLISDVGAEVDHQWVRSSAYPRHEISVASFQDAMGSGKALTISFTGLNDKPDLICVLRLYDEQPYGDVSVEVKNSTGSGVTVQAIRDVDALGQPRIDLGGAESEDRVLAESESEDPSVHIGGLEEAPHQDYRGVRAILVYNLTSKQSVLLSALTEDRFLTVSNLQVGHNSSGAAQIVSFTLDSTGTTQIVLRRSPIAAAQQVELSLPVAPGQSLHSERVMFAAGRDYLSQLENYGAAVRHLHHVHFTQKDDPMGWWSWTAFYGGINQGETLTNAQWLAAHLKPLGYDYFHIDEGYDYARGEYTTANATQFPGGMLPLEHKICNLGLAPGIWTAPFEVSERSWVYEQHKDWLVHDSHGAPIFIGHVNQDADRLYVLDTTNPEAQAYLRQTYRTLTRQWGIRYIKLDFMDSSAIEGYRYRPNTAALEAQRIGLKIIRQAVGSDVLLDKDGSMMLAPVGFVNEGRVAPDTGHSFSASRDAVSNIASRFYMNRNFYVSDPDAFSVSREIEPQQHWHESQSGLSLGEARVQIVLAAIAGGMYEIGDDLPTLGSEPKRLALVNNQELIEMNRLGRAALPLDLMTFKPEDELPSVFYLREDRRQAMLAVFNWTGQPRSHEFTMAELHLPASPSVQAFDVLNHDAPVDLSGASLRLENEPPRSVRLIKLVDTAIPAAAPTIKAEVPSAGRAGDELSISAGADDNPVPALAYRWSFGDGTEATGSRVVHTYTHPGSYVVKLEVTGIDGIPAQQSFALKITGLATTRFNLKDNRRYAPEESSSSIGKE